MSCAVLTRKAGSISQQNNEITDDLRKHVDLQAIVWAANGLGYSWRSLLVQLYKDAEDFDHRKHREVFLEAAASTVAVFNLILEEVGKSGASFDGTADLKTSRQEAKNILEWIESWPSSDPERHRTARDEMESGDVLSIEDIREELLSETA